MHDEPELIVGRTGHREGCINDHDPDDGECYTREDALEDQADDEYHRRKDEGLL